MCVCVCVCVHTYIGVIPFLYAAMTFAIHPFLSSPYTKMKTFHHT